MYAAKVINNEQTAKLAEVLKYCRKGLIIGQKRQKSCRIRRNPVTYDKKPILYETTHEFLDYFGLSTIDDLPKINDILEEVEDEEDSNTDLYTSKYVEENNV